MASNEWKARVGLLMESNYQNQEQEYQVTNSDLNKVALRTMLLNASFNYERMQANGILYSLAPVLGKVHKNKDDLKTSMKTHLDFFNTHTYIVSFILGLVVAMEEKKESPDLIRSMKVATMGPLAGIGDSLIWFTLLPLLAGIGASMAMDNSIMGPIFFLITFNIGENIVRFGLVHYGYRLGVSALEKIRGLSQKVTESASILGMTVIGALIASYVSLNLAAEVKAGEAIVNVQADVLDKIMPNMLPLLYTLWMFYMIKKKNTSPMVLILITVVVCVVGKFLGIV